jgi:hypothetical protein
MRDRSDQTEFTWEELADVRQELKQLVEKLRRRAEQGALNEAQVAEVIGQTLQSTLYLHKAVEVLNARVSRIEQRLV